MRIVPIAALLVASAPAFAAEPSGCDKFKWPIAREQAAMTAPGRASVASGGEITVGKAVTLALKPLADAKLPQAPERAQAGDSYAGFVNVALPAQGSTTISLSAGAWVDVVQDGQYLKPTAFSGATDCDGIRKTMKFAPAQKPFVVQISGNKTGSIVVLVSAAE